MDNTEQGYLCQFLSAVSADRETSKSFGFNLFLGFLPEIGEYQLLVADLQKLVTAR
ncbi:hypothetical protein [Dendronalium sp. ChiSLP03b]|uniref:hypothetical protein n=1 Tax=Dendronalium sp. ChiSLP03b TaxID=3075381 RepID=UPI00391C91DE